MKEWLKLSFLLCIFGFARDLRPYESYGIEIFRGSGHNFTQDEINRYVLPTATYSHLAALGIIFLITDFLRYKPLIILTSIGGIITASLLIWTSSLLETQIAMTILGVSLASEVAYYTYIYAKVDKQYYPKVSAHTRAACSLGKLFAGLSSQSLIYFKLTNYESLLYITLGTQIFATLWAFSLPKVNGSLYFNRKKSIDNPPTTSNSSSLANLPDTKSTAKLNSLKVGTPKAFKLLWSHFYNAYSNLEVLQWSIWYAVTMCGMIQIYSYIQLLWVEIEPNMQVSWNGAVDVLFTTLATLMALAAGYIHAGRLKSLQSLLLVSVFAAVEGGAVLICSQTSNIFVAYGAFILFTSLYSFSITVASAEIARPLEEDSFGLVFGVNTFIALILQTVLTIIVATDSVFTLNIRVQYRVYAFYYITISVVFSIVVAVAYLIGRRKHPELTT